MFLAVALATSTSMGLGANNALLNAVAQETRDVVAQILSSPHGHLHVAGRRIVRVRDLLKNAANNENVTMERYIEMLRDGSLQGGGPELTVLSNVLRRPISIYELDENENPIQDASDDAGETSENENTEGKEDGGAKGRNDNRVTNGDDRTRALPSNYRIKCVGSFGDLFKDPCSEIPNSAVTAGVMPGAYSWHIHILVVDAGPGEKHACALLPNHCYT